MSFWKQLLDMLVDPNLIVLLMSIGLLGITIEVMNPGLIFPGTVGAISPDHGPLRPPGAADQLGGRAAHPARASGSSSPRRSSSSHGALAIAGTVSFVIGALLLFDPAGLRLPGVDLGRARDRA